ncbi:MAG: NirD/YgiW/YdeI family stress tolerance protein [Alphaproteobacteria bacterium]|nr:NirD/YgiW/YdeI family stress tolerance protein [Alphaproteobacteria bacterium]
MKQAWLILLFGMCSSGLVFGDYYRSTAEVLTQKGGFKGSSVSSAIKTVSDIKRGDMEKKAWVTVRGNIVEQRSKDKYLFKDSTGEIVVEIDDEYWSDVKVNENDEVELSGEVDKGYFKIELDVKSPVKKLQRPEEKSPVKEVPQVTEKH